VNLDFSTEADMVKKLRVSLALQPIATALFASSPFKDGKPSGFISTRADVWSDVDRERTGTLPFAFEDGMGFERYVDWMLDVPMYFVYRDGKYLDASGHSFRDFMAGKLAILPGEIATMGDWMDHLTTAFPEVRLKRYLEMRGADGGPWRSLCGLPAFWVGLLYEQDVLNAAWELVKDWTLEEREKLRRDVAHLGLKAPFRGKTVQDIALQVMALADAGLEKRHLLNRSGVDERVFLKSLWVIAESGQNAADDMLRSFFNEWEGKVDPVFEEYAY
jgi:glutamate--cysteine ligase